MQYKKIISPRLKSIALVGHDNMKTELIGWCKNYANKLSKHKLYATGTTGALIRVNAGLNIHSLISGPLGGDQQIGAMISEKKIDMMIFFWDPLEAHPHDPDVKALLRLAAVWNIPVACNRASADMLVTSPLFDRAYEKTIPDCEEYILERVF